MDEIKDSRSHTEITITIEDHIDNNSKDSPVKKTAIRFPTQLEKHFYPCAQQPLQEEEQVDCPPIISRKRRILHYLHEKFPSRIVRRVLKCTIAYFLTALFSLIHPLSTAIGQACTLTTTGMLFSHPGRTMGAQFDATVTAVMGVLAAILYTFAASAASVAYDQNHPSTLTYGRAINATFLFVGIFGAQMLRQIYPKFHFFSLQFMIIQIFSMTRAIDYVTVPFHYPLTYGIPLMIGHGISLVVNLIFWPETAVDGLGRALKETMKNSRDMLNLITKQFFLDPQSDPVAESVVDSTAAKMRQGMTKVKTAYHEAKYEMSYTYIRPQQLGQVRKSLGRLTKHLNILGSCLKTERELFESAIEALRDEMKDSDSDSEETTTNNDVEGTQTTRPTSRRSYSEEDLNLLRTALRATNDFLGVQQHSRQTSTNTTPMSSKPNSRASSRPNSVYNLVVEDERPHHQRVKSVSSLKSLLPKLSIPKPQPPKKSKKQTEYHHRHLLLTYLESLRDPLMELSLDCANALECVCDSIQIELDMDRDDDARQTWKSFLQHLLKIGKPKPPKTDTFSDRHNGSTTCNCSQTIRLAILQFDKSEQQRMHALYELNKAKTGEEALDLGMRQELFLVFFFIFTMREVANELQEMTLQMDELRMHSRKTSFNGKKKKQLYIPGMNLKMWHKWARGTNHQSVKDKGGYTFGALTTYMPRPVPMSKSSEDIVSDEYKLDHIKRNRKESIKPCATNESDIVSPAMLRPRHTLLNLNDNRQSNDSSSQSDDAKKPTTKIPAILRMRYNIWLKLQYFERYEFKFALKMAVAVLVLCIPAWTPSSVEWYNGVRGQWSALTVIAIMNPTSGGTLEASFWRIVGTLVGAFTGWAALAAGENSPYLLGAFAVLLAIPFFYIHLGSTYNKVGIVTLTTYMVVALSRYANPTAGETVDATVWKRTITLIVGIFVALLLNSLVCPFIARHMVRTSIAGCMGQLENYYTYLLGTFLYHDPQNLPTDADITKGEKMENKIQSAIDACSVLLELTDHEPRFHGPFPKLFYKEMIISMRNILDRMVNMRIALLEMPSSVKSVVCAKEYQTDRKDLLASMLLCFHTLALSLRSKTPLPAYMPSARVARLKLIYHRRINTKKTNWVKFRNLTWFAMACSSDEIIEELEYFSHLVRYIVGENEYAPLARSVDYLGDVVNTTHCTEEFDPAKLGSLYT